MKHCLKITTSLTEPLTANTGLEGTHIANTEWDGTPLT